MYATHLSKQKTTYIRRRPILSSLQAGHWRLLHQQIAVIIADIDEGTIYDTLLSDTLTTILQDCSNT